MTIYRITQGIEIKFWNIVTPMMSDEGALMKTIRYGKRGMRGQPLNIALLILIWAAIGFVSGMLIGRIILILQLL